MAPIKPGMSALAAYSSLGSRSQKRRKMKKIKKKLARAEALSNGSAKPDASETRTTDEKAVGKKSGKKRSVEFKRNLSTEIPIELNDSESDQLENCSADDQTDPVPRKKSKTKKSKDPKPDKKSSSDKRKANVSSAFSSVNDSLNLPASTSRRSLISSTPARMKGENQNEDDSHSDVSDLSCDDIFPSRLQYSSSNGKMELKPEGSHLLGKMAFQQLLGDDISVDHFMKKYWEKTVAYIPARDPKMFKDLLSTKLMDKVLRREAVHFTRDIDVTSYKNGVRETHNIDDARAQAHVVWDHYLEGCSVRLLHPHSYSKPLLAVMSTLQEFFGCMVGANSYLTPPNSQGFAPHYDDIEAFILQLEGKKHWKVYKPRRKNEVLPRFSSPNFSDSDLFEGPVFEGVLSPGDILYFPRGFIHQGRTMPGAHSLHVTLSIYQKTAWVDLMEKVLPKALQQATASDVRFRTGLPIGYLGQAGKFTKGDSASKKKLQETVAELTSKLVKHIDIDSAIDELGIRFMHDALPPVLTSDERKCSVIENGLRMHKNGRLENRVDYLPQSTRIRIARANSCRLVGEQVVDEDGKASQHMRLYYTTENSILYHGEEPNFLEIEPEYLRPLWTLIKAYPGFIAIDELVTDSDDGEVVDRLVSDLWYLGIVVTESPLEPTLDETGNEVSIPDDAEANGSNESGNSSDNSASRLRNGADDSLESFYISREWVNDLYRNGSNDSSSDDDDWVAGSSGDDFIDSSAEEEEDSDEYCGSEGSSV
ncbi:Ribosomal oxygenase 1 [Nesidiocoris tenuis]|uniref:Bifunctional lysine-specific demethylase and histidyl-hydroxylase n=1 Tax=Nesidiocoris tenuis TaxID=355587 RepID=A0ABN7ARJ8_9HEMI|nr:Ribosomal oxygenase 1 [Nesidiocoris tenuis]